jgi:hypothetical protein
MEGIKWLLFTLVGRIKCTTITSATVTPYYDFHECFDSNMTQSTNTVVNLAKTRQFMFTSAGKVTHNLCVKVGSSICTLSH